MVVPAAPDVGVKDVITGAGNEKMFVEVTLPPNAVIEILPDAPSETIAVILVGEFTVKEFTGTPPTETAEIPEKFVPVIVTLVPGPPLVGVKEVIVGAG